MSIHELCCDSFGGRKFELRANWPGEAERPLRSEPRRHMVGSLFICGGGGEVPKTGDPDIES